jgi:hypothetical protein
MSMCLGVKPAMPKGAQTEVTLARAIVHYNKALFLLCWH